MSIPNLHAIPAGFPSLPTYSATWRAVRFELSPGTGEWITSHIAAVDNEGYSVHQVVRPAVLRSMFGSDAKRYQVMLDMVGNALEAYLSSGGDLGSWSAPIEGFSATEIRRAFARQGRLQALRMAAKQSTALCALEELDAPVETSSTEEESGTWVSRVKDVVVIQRPDLSMCFDRPGMLYSETVRFGFLYETMAAHFGNLNPTAISTSLRFARGKLLELKIATRTLNLTQAKLIAALPSQNDIMWSDRHLDAVRRAGVELQQEAAEHGVQYSTAHTVDEAANQLLELVS